MKDLIIVCAGGYGKEAIVIAEEMNAIEEQWNILGFLDDNIEIGTEIYRGHKVIGRVSDWKVDANQYFSLGIANPQTKDKLYHSLKSKNANFATLIRPQTLIPKETIIGEGCVIGNAWIGLEVELGKCVHVMGSMMGSSKVGDFSTTTGFVNIAAASLGKRVFVGSHAVVLNGRKIGDDAFVCAGSIVMTNVKQGVKVMGNPAKKFDFC